MTKLKAFWEKINYETICFIILAGSVFANIDKTDVEAWDIYPYVGDYSHGIADKFLTGEIISWFTDYVSVKKVFAIAITLGMVLCALLSFFSGQVIRRTERENKTAVTVTVFSLWLLPSGIGGLFRYIGVPDVFMALTLILCIVLAKNRGSLWLVPLVSAAAVGFHQIYTTLYFPTLFVAICFFAIRKGYATQGFVAGIITTLTTLASFVFITFFSSRYLTYGSIDSLIEYLNSKSNMNFDDELLRWVFRGQYFSDIKTYVDGAASMLIDTKTLITAGVVILPLVAIIFYTYISAMKQSDDKRKKFLFILCSLSWVPTVATCFLMRNLFRISAAMWITQFLIMSLFIYFGDEDFLKAFNKTKSFIMKRKEIYLAYLLVVISFRKMI